MKGRQGNSPPLLKSKIKEMEWLGQYGPVNWGARELSPSASPSLKNLPSPFFTTASQVKLAVTLLPRLILSPSSLTSLSHKTSHSLPYHLFLPLPHDISLSSSYGYFAISSSRAQCWTCARGGPSEDAIWLEASFVEVNSLCWQRMQLAWPSPDFPRLHHHL